MDQRKYDACVIAASAGGVTAIIEVLSALDQSIGLSLIALLHLGEEDRGLARVLGARCSLPVQTAEAGFVAEPGRVWLAPAGYHLLVEKDRRFTLSLDEKVCHVRPSADVLFASAADVWHERLIGVVLTGSNEDGAQGLREIRSRKGLGIVQSPQDAESPQMPAEAIRVAGADHILNVSAIGPLLNQLYGG